MADAVPGLSESFVLPGAAVVVVCRIPSASETGLGAKMDRCDVVLFCGVAPRRDVAPCGLRCARHSHPRYPSKSPPLLSRSILMRRVRVWRISVAPAVMTSWWGLEDCTVRTTRQHEGYERVSGSSPAVCERYVMVHRRGIVRGTVSNISDFER